MTEVQLLHKGQPQGKWLSVEQMIEDLNSKAVQLEAGDRLIVGENDCSCSSVPKRSDVREYMVAEIIPFRRQK